MLFSTTLAYTQDMTVQRTTATVDTRVEIRGQVIAADSKQPVPGAAVFIKGTTLGTVTDGKGNFTLTLDSRPEAPVEVRFLGMETQEVYYTGQRMLTIELRTSAQAIDVVSTGYQLLDKRESASSISTINGDSVLMGNATSIDAMLQGRIPGLQVLNSTSTPGAATSIRIRGTSSITGNHEPLWVIDGIIQEDPISIPTEELNNLDNINLIGNAISGLNPMDVQRIDVLKDASATAIYGARAANGVIVITTKRGKQGDPRVAYSMTLSVAERPGYRKLNRMNSQERIDVSREIEEKGLAFAYAPAAVGYEGLLYELYDRRITQDQFLEKVRRLETVNTDWFDLLYRTSFSQKHNVSISGANDKVNYYVSGAFVNNLGNVRGEGHRQYNAFAKLQYRLRSNITASVQMQGSIHKKDYLHSALSAYSYAYNTSRTIPAFNEDGSYAYYTATRGFEQALERNILNDRDNSGRTVNMRNFGINANLAWNIVNGLKVSAQASIQAADTEDRSWYGEASYMATEKRKRNYGEELPDDEVFKTDRYAASTLPYGGELKTQNERNFNYTARLQVDYNRLLDGAHSISLSGGTEARSNQYNGITATQWGFLPDRGEKFIVINPLEWTQYYAQLVRANPNVSKNRLTNFASLYGIASYSYRSRYILNANIRADGSNKFGQDKSARFLPIWSVAARWNAHNEPFLAHVGWLNELAPRVSYGIQGNVSDDQTPDMILKIGTMDQYSKEYYNTLDKLPNPMLKWEKTTNYNAALDFALFGNRLTGSVEYYYKKGRDMIVSIEVSPTVGVNSLTVNQGDVMNRGYEFALNSTLIRSRDFMWSMNINGGKNVNRVTRGGMESEYTHKQYVNGTAALKGYALNSFFSYRFDKLDSNGLPTFLGAEETEGMTKEEMFAQAFTYSGKRLADVQGGLGTNFRYKDFQFNLFFAYSLGSKIRMNDLYSPTGQHLVSPQQNMSREFVDRWRKPGDEAWAVIPALSTDPLSMNRTIKIADNRWDMYNKSDLRVVSGDFLRLRSASLQYNVPADFCKKIGIQSLNLRFEGYNLWLLSSKKLKGQDPEQISFFGLGGGSTPPVSSYAFIFNLSF
jgi:TonB-linked SusC/RagA family outer membrane protein